MDKRKIYFYTCTIHQWIPLLSKKARKEILIESLNHLVKEGKLVVYAFVIMSNHLHSIVEIMEWNGKESPISSFKKFTAHRLLMSIKYDPDLSSRFRVDKKDRTHEIWPDNSRAVYLYSPEVIFQKLDYIHHNPVSGKWSLASDFTEYDYSSAAFYYSDPTRFGFLTHVRDRI